MVANAAIPTEIVTTKSDTPRTVGEYLDRYGVPPTYNSQGRPLLHVVPKQKKINEKQAAEKEADPTKEDDYKNALDDFYKRNPSVQPPTGNSDPTNGQAADANMGSCTGGGEAQLTGDYKNVDEKLVKCAKLAGGFAGVKSVKIISGRRSFEKQARLFRNRGNTQVASPDKSQHVQGRALDIATKVMGPAAEPKFIIGMLACGGYSTGFYAGNGHVHFGLDGGSNYRQWGIEFKSKFPNTLGKAMTDAGIGNEKTMPRQEAQSRAQKACGRQNPSANQNPAV